MDRRSRVSFRNQGLSDHRHGDRFFADSREGYSPGGIQQAWLAHLVLTADHAQALWRACNGMSDTAKIARFFAETAAISGK
jgi:hypothetical protein